MGMLRVYAKALPHVRGRSCALSAGDRSLVKRAKEPFNVLIGVPRRLGLQAAA